MPIETNYTVSTRELQSAIRKFDPEYQKEIRREFYKIATSGRDKVRSAVPLGPAKGGHVYRAYTSGTTGFTPYLKWTRDYKPYSPWLEFGGQIGPPGPFRERKREGRYFYPILYGYVRPEAAKQAEILLDRVVKRLGMA